MGNRIYGCDDCLAVCPWNKYAQATHEMKLQAREDLVAPSLAELATLDDAGFRQRFAGSPVKRIGRDRFVRNVLIAIGNSGEPALSGRGGATAGRRLAAGAGCGGLGLGAACSGRTDAPPPRHAWRRRAGRGGPRGMGGGVTGTLFCFGLGYSAGTLAHRLAAQGWEIRGTTRRPEKAQALEAMGWRMFPFDRARPLPPEALAGVTHGLTSIAPDEAGDPVLDLHGTDLRALGWIGYLGTTAVYGDRQGGWVDEATPIEPTLARADRRARAEAAWLASGLPVHIFRLAGIYGPGRNAFVNLKDGTARRIVKPGQLFSRIHVEDIASVLEASIARPRPGAIYNVCDDEPAPPAGRRGLRRRAHGRRRRRPSNLTRPPTSRRWRGPSTRTAAGSGTS